MRPALWTSKEIEAATGGRAVGAPFAAGGVSIDTRTIAPRDLFVALEGERDGHDFLAAAFEAGARGPGAARRIRALRDRR
jgi:UDP-N-acetylmuramoyl-tripeptide--D-alanyl-D-alanine ligase